MNEENTNMSLVKMVTESAKIEEMLAASGGEITEEVEAALAVLDLKLPAKIDGYAFFLERMAQVACHYDERVKAYERMSKSANAVIKRLEDNIKYAMESTSTDEIRGIDVKFKLTNTAGKVVIDNEENLDPAYTILETVTKIDKKRIAADLKLNLPVRGARLEIGKSLRRYTNTPGGK